MYFDSNSVVSFQVLQKSACFLHNCLTHGAWWSSHCSCSASVLDSFHQSPLRCQFSILQRPLAGFSRRSKPLPPASLCSHSHRVPRPTLKLSYGLLHICILACEVDSCVPSSFSLNSTNLSCACGLLPPQTAPRHAHSVSAPSSMWTVSSHFSGNCGDSDYYKVYNRPLGCSFFLLTGPFCTKDGFLVCVWDVFVYLHFYPPGCSPCHLLPLCRTDSISAQTILMFFLILLHLSSYSSMSLLVMSTILRKAV